MTNARDTQRDRSKKEARADFKSTITAVGFLTLGCFYLGLGEDATSSSITLSVVAAITFSILFPLLMALDRELVQGAWRLVVTCIVVASLTLLFLVDWERVRLGNLKYLALLVVPIVLKVGRAISEVRGRQDT